MPGGGGLGRSLNAPLLSTSGGGYYYGLGVLHDRAGGDAYFGNRYSQAFAAHTALGMLVDDAGGARSGADAPRAGQR